MHNYTIEFLRQFLYTRILSAMQFVDTIKYATYFFSIITVYIN